jgi:hypothetical protein
VYAGFVAKMRPPAPTTLNQIKGYQIYSENGQIVYVEHGFECMRLQVGAFRSGRGAGIRKRALLTLLYECKQTVSPCSSPCSCQPLTSRRTSRRASHHETTLEASIPSMNIYVNVQSMLDQALW